MSDRRPFLFLVAGLIISLGLHALVLVPAMISVMESKNTTYHHVRANFMPEHFRQPEQPPEQEQLGLEESEASTMTWIGFEEYQEHLAELAEVEQAAFTTEPVGVDPNQPQATQQPQDLAQADPMQPTDPTQPAAAPEQATSPDAAEQLETFAQAPTVGPGPIEGPPQNPAAIPAVRGPEEDFTKPAPDPTQQPAQPTTQQPAEPAQPQQQPVEQPQPPAQPAGTPATPSDQQSDPFSTVKVPIDQIRLGKPLAAHGLQIMPMKPKFTTLTMMTSAPANPRAELRFRRDGKPARVRLMESSGDPRIDEAILNSLYRWRANPRSKRLRELRRGDTVPIRIQIVLVDRG